MGHHLWDGLCTSLQVMSDVKDPFVRNYLDLLCFLLSGLPANGTIAAEGENHKLKLSAR